MAGESGRKADSGPAVGVVDYDAPLPEQRLAGGLLGPEQRGHWCAVPSEPRDRVVAGEASARLGDRLVALLEAVEASEVVEVPQLREVERVTQAAPEMVFGDHGEREPAAV